MILFKLIKAFWDDMRLIRTMPKPEACLKEKVSIARAEEIQIEFYSQFKDAEFYVGMLDDHKKWLDKEWKPFIAKIKEGDELWHFKSAPIYWEHLMGREGFAILRNGKTMHSINTIIN